MCQHWPCCIKQAHRAPSPPPPRLQAQQALPDKGAPLVVGCQSGRRSLAACDILSAAGYGSLNNVEGGWAGAWVRCDPETRALVCLAPCTCSCLGVWDVPAGCCLLPRAAHPTPVLFPARALQPGPAPGCQWRREQLGSRAGQSCAWL